MGVVRLGALMWFGEQATTVDVDNDQWALPNQTRGVTGRSAHDKSHSHGGQGIGEQGDAVQNGVISRVVQIINEIWARFHELYQELKEQDGGKLGSLSRSQPPSLSSTKDNMSAAT